MFLISMLRYLLVSIRTFIYIYIKDIPKDIPEYRILFKKRFCSKFLMFLDLTYEKKKTNKAQASSSRILRLQSVGTQHAHVSRQEIHLPGIYVHRVVQGQAG